MSQTQEFFTRDHRSCDELWGRLESAAGRGQAEARRLWEEYDHAMRRHFAMEEEVLFPRFEEATGMSGCGPTMVMRMEHAQMKGVLDQMASEMERGDLQGFVDQGDTLLMLVQQHNVKEEGILYPMADQELSSRWEELSLELSAYR